MWRLLSIVFTFLAICSDLPAADPWKSKPVPDWTREETLQFFRESPWVRQVTLGRPLQDGQPLFSGSPFDGMTLAGQGCLSCAHIERREEQPRPGGTAGQSATPVATYFIQWTSARIVCQGFAHLLALQGQGSEDPEPSPLDVFVVTVGGADLRAFEGIEEPQLQKEAWLRPKKSKAKIAASRVNVLRANDQHISVINFGFPREQDGQPIIDEAERAVEFRCRVREKTLTAEFNLRTMVVQGNRDL